MKNLLTRTLFISLLLSAAIPSGIQAGVQGVEVAEKLEEVADKAAYEVAKRMIAHRKTEEYETGEALNVALAAERKAAYAAPDEKANEAATSAFEVKAWKIAEKIIKEPAAPSVMQAGLCDMLFNSALFKTIRACARKAAAKAAKVKNRERELAKEVYATYAVDMQHIAVEKADKPDAKVTVVCKEVDAETAYEASVAIADF